MGTTLTFGVDPPKIPAVPARCVSACQRDLRLTPACKLPCAAGWECPRSPAGSGGRASGLGHSRLSGARPPPPRDRPRPPARGRCLRPRPWRSEPAGATASPPGSPACVQPWPLSRAQTQARAQTCRLTSWPSLGLFPGRFQMPGGCPCFPPAWGGGRGPGCKAQACPPPRKAPAAAGREGAADPCGNWKASAFYPFGNTVRNDVQGPLAKSS